MRSRQVWLGVLLGMLALVLDRATKSWFVQQPSYYWSLGDGLVALQYYLNTDMAFSLPLFPVIYFTLVLLVLGVIIRQMIQAWTNQRNPEFIIGWFIFIGAISNLYDRWRYGGVIDFIHIPLGSIFNLADVYIVGAMLVWAIVLYGKQKIQTTN